MKKNRILIIAIALSIFFHILIFIFAPELQSEINSNDYLKRITKISIFRDDSNRDAVTTGRRDDSNRDAVTTGRRNDSNRDAVTTGRRNEKKSGAENRNNVITGSRDNDTENTAPRDAETTERRDDDNRDDGTTERRDEKKSGAENRNNVITGSRDNDTENTAPRDAVTPGRHDDNNTPKTAGELAVIPKALNPKTPPYPEILEEEGIEGTVTLELLISKDGKVLKARVIKSDHELFSESALKAAKKYKFSPGKLADGTSADSLIEFVVKFEISL